MKFVSHKKLKKRNYFLIGSTIVIAIFLISIIAFSGAKYWYRNQLKPISIQSRSEVIEIKSGTNASEIAQLLQKKHIIRSANAFLWYLKLNSINSDLQAGTYELDASSSVQQIVDQLAGGKVANNLFTILPGQRLAQIEAAFAKAGYSASDIADAMNVENYKNHPAFANKPPSASLEGYLYPDSYQTTASSKPKQIIEQSLDMMAKKMTPDLIDSFAKNNLTPHQAIILASIVTKEVSDVKQKPIVASVFYNRLKVNMPLGSDVTYQYIAKILGVDPSPDIDSPYNTRKFAGLPPGPISNITKADLDAVAYPATTDYLFFVAGDDGKVYYSKTIQEHEALAKEHCKILCSTY